MFLCFCIADKMFDMFCNFPLLCWTVSIPFFQWHISCTFDVLKLIDIKEGICFYVLCHSLLQELNALFSDLYSAYQHFIGQPHFDALLEVLRYQDVAMLLKELTESIRNLVCYCWTYTHECIYFLCLVSHWSTSGSLCIKSALCFSALVNFSRYKYPRCCLVVVLLQ